MLSKTTKSKIFILDTNVILHDHTCIYQFEENDIILPITVLEELDKFKRGNDLILGVKKKKPFIILINIWIHKKKAFILS